MRILAIHTGSIWYEVGKGNDSILINIILKRNINNKVYYQLRYSDYSIVEIYADVDSIQFVEDCNFVDKYYCNDCIYFKKTKDIVFPSKCEEVLKNGCNKKTLMQ